MDAQRWWRTQPAGDGLVIVNAFCNFIKQLEYPGEVLAKLYVANPGRSSFDSYTTLERSDLPGTLYATGGATIVWMNFPKQKSVPLPAQLRALLD